MQFQNARKESEILELIEGTERDRRRLSELLDGIRVGAEVDAMADGMREQVWADVRMRIRRPGIAPADCALRCGCGRGGMRCLRQLAAGWISHREPSGCCRAARKRFDAFGGKI